MVCVFPLDVDECVFSPPVCPQNTECHNTPGSFTCTGNQHQTFVALLTHGHTAWAHHIVYTHKTSFVSVAYIHTNMMSNMHGVTGHSQKSETECSRTSILLCGMFWFSFGILFPFAMPLSRAWRGIFIGLFSGSGGGGSAGWGGSDLAHTDVLQEVSEPVTHPSYRMSIINTTKPEADKA